MDVKTVAEAMRLGETDRGGKGAETPTEGRTCWQRRTSTVKATGWAKREKKWGRDQQLGVTGAGWTQGICRANS